jgi:4-hydroxyphenylpyruvate dioxygenase
MGWEFHDAEKAFEVAVAKGAKPYRESHPFNGIRAIYGIGDSLIFFMEAKGPKSVSAFFKPHPEPIKSEPRGFLEIDHLTNNVHKGSMHKWGKFYMDIFGFHEYRYFHIRGKETGLTSYALQAPSKKFCIPINEGSEPTSQIVQFVQDYHGEGVQHLAFTTKDLCKSVHQMKTSKQGSDVKFLDIDNEYYADVFERVPNVVENHQAIKDLDILVDNDGTTGEGGYLLQIFTTEIIGPIFIELIQRNNHNGFGENNFGALFRTMERDQKRRGRI